MHTPEELFPHAQDGTNSFINQHLHWRWTFYVLIIWSFLQALALIIVSPTPWTTFPHFVKFNRYRSCQRHISP